MYTHAHAKVTLQFLIADPIEKIQRYYEIYSIPVCIVGMAVAVVCKYCSRVFG
jgi:hypothetical protein